jgi:cytoskeletal protein CcmA (bactofilin family)
MRQPGGPEAPNGGTPAPAAAPRMSYSGGSGTAVLGRSVTVKGQIVSEEDLVIDGDVEGTVEVRDHRLTLGPNGKLRASMVKAKEIVIQGSLNGNVEAKDKVYIRKDATLVGDIQTAGIVIEDGAYFKGGIDITRNGRENT